MANEKVIHTRLSLKIDTYEHWTNLSEAGKGGNLVLNKGEIGLCEIPAGNGAATTAPTVLFKVGDGTLPFHHTDPTKCLKWASALAADVYDWAKKTEDQHKEWLKTNHADLDTRYSFSTDGDKLVVKKTLYTNGVAGTEENVGTYEFLTAAEVAETLKNYYTKAEVDAKFAGIDTGVHSVELTSGASNGTLELVVDGEGSGDIAVKGLQDAAYATVASLNEYAEGRAAQAMSEIEGNLGNGSLKVKTAEHADAAGKVDNALTVKVGGADVVFDGSAAKTADVDSAIAAGVAEAKKYANDNDANTEYHVEYDSTNKKIKLVAGADANQMEIDATAFIKDGMIDTVTIGTDNDLVITFNTAAGKDDIRLPLDQLVDIYTGGATDTVTVNVSDAKVVTAEVKTNSIKDGHIATNAAIAKTKLATDVQTTLTNADTAHSWGDHSKANYLKAADIAGKADKVKSATAGNFAGLDANGNLTDSGVKASDFQSAGDYLSGTVNGGYFDVEEWDDINFNTSSGDSITVNGNPLAFVKDIPTTPDDIGAAPAPADKNVYLELVNNGNDGKVTMASSGFDTVNFSGVDLQVGGNDVLTTASTISTDKLYGGSEIWIIDCGTSTTVI